MTAILIYCRNDAYDSYVSRLLNCQHTFDEPLAIHTYGLPSQTALLAASTVCRGWKPYAIEQLYKSVILLSPQHLWQFKEVVVKNKYLAGNLREIFLLDSPKGPSRLIPPVDGLQSGNNSAIRRHAAQDFVSILRVCRSIHTVGVHYGRTESLFPEVKGEIHTELSKLESLRRWSADGQITSHIAWDNPEGIAQHPQGAITLTDISMHEMFADLRSMIVPVMRRLSVRNCRSQYLTWLIPTVSPSIEELILTDNIVLEAGPDPQRDRQPLNVTAPTLRALTLRGKAEWRYFRSGGWRDFPKLSRIATGSPEATRLNCAKVDLPLSLRELVLIQPTSRWDIIIGETDPAALIREVLEDRASLSSWLQLRIDVQKDFATDKAFQEGTEQLRMLCDDRNIDLKFYPYDEERSIERKPFSFQLPSKLSMAAIWTEPLVKPQDPPFNMPNGQHNA